ncbi:MAG: FAD-dependent oxidoreductase, partial [Polyangiaceae bacterium]|nr:FAD-dependent oxidoreductase [Polyangiaceae bacterium]
CGRGFGIKLSNTLEVLNDRDVFPSTEKTMYMSGRALFPLTAFLALKISRELDCDVPISFCGGADAFQFSRLVASGLSPITVCTDLLKPGGYARLHGYLAELGGSMTACGTASINDFIENRASRRSDPSQNAADNNLSLHVAQLFYPWERQHAARPKPLATKGDRQLHHFDCIAAPCQEACPTHQNVPKFIRLAEKRPDDAMNVILNTNALPAVTGCVCPQPCVDRCVRNHYDRPISIRYLKQFAAFHQSKPVESEPTTTRGIRVAIVGAGPTGLSAAYYLAQAGCSVTVFDSRQNAGGIAAATIPDFRLANVACSVDIDRIKKAGVVFNCGVQIGRDITLQSLQSEGYGSIVLATGAPKTRKLGIPGENAKGVIDALDFLEAVRRGSPPKLGNSVVVVGGGNTAFDAARVANRLLNSDTKGADGKITKGRVTIVYRRSMDEMPAHLGECESAIEEGVNFVGLRAPYAVVLNKGSVAKLHCTRMKLGDPDSSGRRSPIPMDGPKKTYHCQTIIVAVGQYPNVDYLSDIQLDTRSNGTIIVDPESCETSVDNIYAGGDVARGPSTVIQAVADGRRIAQAIAARENLVWQKLHEVEEEPRSTISLIERRSEPYEQYLPHDYMFFGGYDPANPDESPSRDTANSDQIEDLDDCCDYGDPAAPKRYFDGQTEALIDIGRCLSCDQMCGMCVTVCPNRANQMFESTPVQVELPSLLVDSGQLVVSGTTSFSALQRYQVLNIADFCNECGNCTTFCPSAGAPFRDKPRVHITEQGLNSAEFDSFHIRQSATGTEVLARFDGTRHVLEITDSEIRYRGQGVLVLFDKTMNMQEADAVDELADGTEVDLTIAGKMFVIARGAGVIP